MKAGGVDWGKLIRLSALVMLILILAIAWSSIIIRAVNRSRDPRIRSEQEFLDIFNQVMAEHGISISDDGNPWTQVKQESLYHQKRFCLVLPNGNTGSVLLKRQENRSTSRIYELTIYYDMTSGAYMQQITDGILSVFEPEFFTAEPVYCYYAEEPYFYSYEDIRNSAIRCDAAYECHVFYDQVTTSTHGTQLTFSSSYDNGCIIKSLNLYLYF
ncbi:MAG: hypothetical protein IKU32_07245 [Clostridia bacterium]|nr:hypothetical protein [Clostridia bacterium]